MPGAIDLRQPASPATDELVDRMLDATMACLGRFGVAKTTIDDVAREAGCSRATVYRYFANRSVLVNTAVERELDALDRAIHDAASSASTLEDAVVAMFVTAASRIIGHAALQRALELEPEVVLPSLSFEGGDRLFAEASQRFAPVFARFVPPDRAPRAAEWCTRVLLAYLHPDRAPLSMTDETQVRALIGRHVLPAINPTPVPTVPAR